ncbi:MAG: SIMPL domain-containing protein [Campylobacteraceae bacterium]|jgi:hypothetical protein|nr:SIMPL domain-containing protein [Campylobacteraceae bacterium]
MQKNVAISVAVIIGVFFVVGLSILGLSLKNSYKYDNYIRVTGSASKIIEPSGLFWSFEFVNSGYDLNEVLEQNEEDKEVLKEFFISAGINENDISFEELRIEASNEYYDDYDDSVSGGDFSSIQSVFIQTSNIKAIKAARNKMSELFKEGFTLKYDYGDVSYFRYIYDTSYQQDLIDEALVNAKAAAQKVAERSNSALGDIYSISVNDVYDTQYADAYIPNKQISIMVDVSYYIK